jgi:hypothetical protein
LIAWQRSGRDGPNGEKTTFAFIPPAGEAPDRLRRKEISRLRRTRERLLRARIVESATWPRRTAMVEARIRGNDPPPRGQPTSHLQEKFSANDNQSESSMC